MADHEDDRFEWDGVKSDRCLKERFFDFEFASQVFDSDHYYEEYDERDYGEERSVCVGLIGDEFFTVVYTPRYGRKRLISAWRSSDEEIEKYVGYFGTG